MNTNINKKHIVNWAKFQEKLFVDGVVKIGCYGDSITYGVTGGVTGLEDDPGATVNQTNSDNGEAHYKLQSTRNYPKQLQINLEEIGVDAEVFNLGFEGAFSSDIGEIFYKDRGLDLAVIMLGTNDSLSDEQNVPIDKYLENIEALIERETSRGAAILLVSPTKFRDSDFDAEHNLIENYVFALEQFANANSIPFVNLWKEMQNLSAWCFVDNLHLGIRGYQFIASKIITKILIRGMYPKVSNGSHLGATVHRDGYIPASKKNAPRYAARLESPGPDEMKCDIGQYLMFSNEGGTGYWVFETMEDNVWAIPNFDCYSRDEFNLEMSLNFGCSLRDGTNPQRVNNFDSARSLKLRVGQSGTPVQCKFTKENAVNNTRKVEDKNIVGYRCRNIAINPLGVFIPKKGLHVIKVEGTSTMFYGIDIVSDSGLHSTMNFNSSQNSSLMVNHLVPLENKLNLKDILEIMSANNLAELKFCMYRSHMLSMIKNSGQWASDAQVTVQCQGDVFASRSDAAMFIRIVINSNNILGKVYQGYFKESIQEGQNYNPIDYEFDMEDFLSFSHFH